MYFFIKVLVSALVIAGVSELAKRSSFAAAFTASLPLTSILAMVWMYYERQDTEEIRQLSQGIFWLVLPSLALFLLLPALLKAGIGFPLALLISCLGTAALYGAGIVAYRYFV